MRASPQPTPTAVSVPLRPSRPVVVALYVLFAAEVGRTLPTIEAGMLGVYLGLFGLFLALFTLVLWRPALPGLLLRLYFLVQCAVVAALLVPDPTIDHVTTLFVMLSYQAALVFDGYERWAWVALIVTLTGAVLMLFLGVLQGLALAPVTMAVGIVLPAYVAANQDLQAAQADSQALLAALEERHRRLQSYAGQVEELAAIEERDRLARELHDSVSQVLFSIILHIRSTRILLERDAARVGPQLRLIQDLAQQALAGMRGMIEDLRPESSSGPTT